MITRSVHVSNTLGLHLRAAGVLVQAAGRFACDIWFERDGTRVNGKSIMSLLTLAASQGTELLIHAEGADAAHAVETLTTLIAAGFKEDR